MLEDSEEPRVAGAQLGCVGWEEVKWDEWAGHTGHTCRPWWRLEEGIDFREGILDWKGREGLRMKAGRAVRRGM